MPMSGAPVQPEVLLPSGIGGGGFMDQFNAGGGLHQGQYRAPRTDPSMPPPPDMTMVNEGLNSPIDAGFKSASRPVNSSGIFPATLGNPPPQPTAMPRDLMNFTGLLNNPNIFTRLGVGYNMGGLMGALGLALTDMNRFSQGNRDQQELSDQFNRWDLYQQQRRN